MNTQFSKLTSNLRNRCFLTLVLPLALAGTASADRFECPDNGSVDVASNVAGTTDKLVVVEADFGDRTFILEIYRPNDLDNPNDDVIVAAVEHRPGHNPPATLPPGTRARVKDGSDSDNSGPKGDVSIG